MMHKHDLHELDDLSTVSALLQMVAISPLVPQLQASPRTPTSQRELTLAGVLLG